MPGCARKGMKIYAKFRSSLLPFTLRRSADNLILNLLAKLHKKGAVTGHSYHEGTMRFRVLLGICELGGIHTIELNLCATQLIVGP